MCTGTLDSFATLKSCIDSDEYIAGDNFPQSSYLLLALIKLVLLSVVVKIIKCLHDQIEWFPRGGPCSGT
ncbi:uncharacterized protein N7503_011782 [Penicillium pulvis]|uniref:uncharacterized protein n=1 Tax=Penicillium pulvis TaxID=1562058 RepID=UPI002546E31E|nr:uncharacterized protein N7503_011782 [Penicillium pulvis]KAJ5786570.1 hypothetical protein N7503_011782 [Penicillium pulvis]